MARTKPKTQKQKADRPTGKAAKSGKAGLRSAKDANERRRLKEQKRIGKLQSKRLNYQEQWAAPAPSHLVAKLDRPQVKSKYQSYYEFAVNPEKKDKKLEIKVGRFRCVRMALISLGLRQSHPDGRLFIRAGWRPCHDE